MSFKACKISGTCALILVFVGTAYWLGGRIVEGRQYRLYCISTGKFAQIRAALLSYHSEHGAFPPTKYRDQPDAPEHSWRILLLPYIDMYTKELYSKYNFSERWNSPQNLAVADSVRKYTDLFSMGDNESANYLAIGDGDDWPFKVDSTGYHHYYPLKSLLVVKGTDKFLIIEVPDSKIHWMEPKY